MNSSPRETPGTSLPANQPPVDDTPTTTATVPPVLDDNDKVEKAWVDKVKRIIQKTKHDPYQQSEELTALKADYMKQHYNKIIKVEK